MLLKYNCLAVLLLLFQTVLAQTYKTKIIGVKDGDTVEILYEKKSKTVRLTHIDAPEKNQPYGKKAKQTLSDFCFGKEVKVVIVGKPDRYDRWIAELFYNNQNLNKALVRQGLAWHFTKYSKSENYADLERIVRKKKEGLWKDAHPIAPWDWRKRKKPHLKETRFYYGM